MPFCIIFLFGIHINTLECSFRQFLRLLISQDDLRTAGKLLRFLHLTMYIQSIGLYERILASNKGLLFEGRLLSCRG